MLITFKSKAAADVLMYEEHAEPILALLQKDVKRGVIATDELSAAIHILDSHIAQLRPSAAGQHDADEIDEDDRRGLSAPVGFATRAYPFLEMLRAAQRQNTPVAWGI